MTRIMDHIIRTEAVPGGEYSRAECSFGDYIPERGERVKLSVIDVLREQLRHTEGLIPEVFKEESRAFAAYTHVKESALNPEEMVEEAHGRRKAEQTYVDAVSARQTWQRRDPEGAHDVSQAAKLMDAIKLALRVLDPNGDYGLTAYEEMVEEYNRYPVRVLTPQSDGVLPRPGADLTYVEVPLETAHAGEEVKDSFWGESRPAVEGEQFEAVFPEGYHLLPSPLTQAQVISLKSFKDVVTPLGQPIWVVDPDNPELNWLREGYELASAYTEAEEGA